MNLWARLPLRGIGHSAAWRSLDQQPHSCTRGHNAHCTAAAGGAGKWVAIATAICLGLLCGQSRSSAEDAAPVPRVDTSGTERALAALRGAWNGELDQLASTARSLAMADDCADFVVRPNIPYVYDNFGQRQLAAARIDTVLIVSRAGQPLLWRRADGGRHGGFGNAESFLARLPGLRRTGPVGIPSLAGAVPLANGAALVVAMPIVARAGPGSPKGWLVVARTLDAAQWHRYAEVAHVAANVIDRVAWPSDVQPELNQPLTPVIRVGPTDIRGFLAVPDLRGNAFRAFAITVPRPPVTSKSTDGHTPRYLLVWLPFAAAIACGAGAAPLVLRRRHRPRAAPPRSMATTEPPTQTSDPTTEGVTMPPNLARAEPPSPAGPAVVHVAASGDVEATIDPTAHSRRHRRPIPDALADSPAARNERLRAALVAIDIVFRYQPQMDLQTGRVTGVEALVFLKGAPDDRAPNSIVAQLEAAGLGLPLAERWLQDICSERRLWRRQMGHDFPIGMPVSQRTLEDPGFLPLVRATLEQYELPSRFLELEVPESALDGGAVVARVLAAAQEAGVLIAIDRFSGARSSLHSLAALQVTKLRVDSALFGETSGGARPARLFAAIIGAARGLEIPVCATGVDTPDLLIVAERRGCGLAQGTAVGRPSDGEQFLALVRGSGVDTASLPAFEVEEGLRRISEAALA